MASFGEEGSYSRNQAVGVASYKMAAQASPMEASYDSYGEEESSPEPSAVSVTTAGKLIKRADIRLRVEDIAAIEEPLARLMEKYDAWPAFAGMYENSRSLTIRVPSAFYDDMLSELAGMGRLLKRSENAEDVSLRYYDLESRLATKKELLKTYQGYLGKAANIDEIMTVESKIADLQLEIDKTGTEFRNLVNLIDYSTINAEFSGPVSVSSYSKPTLVDRLSELFGSFGDVASSAVVVVMGIIIYGVPAVLIFILLFWVFFGKIGLLRKLIRFAAGKK